MTFEIRTNRETPQGRKRLNAERAKFFELVSQGYSQRGAAKIVGVNYRTTKRWRTGVWRSPNKKKAGTDTPVKVRPYQPFVSVRYLSESEHVIIADRLRAGRSIHAIARELGRSASTISREVRRNAHPETGAYRPYDANNRATDRRPRPKKGKIAQNDELRAYIQAKPDLRWSPQQIARTIRRDFPDNPEMHVAHETIYLGLYIQGRNFWRIANSSRARPFVD